LKPIKATYTLPSSIQNGDRFLKASYRNIAYVNAVAHHGIRVYGNGMLSTKVVNVEQAPGKFKWVKFKVNKKFKLKNVSAASKSKA